MPYSTLLENLLLAAYDSLNAVIAQHIHGIALRGVRTGSFKVFAESVQYRALARTVYLTEETRIIRTIHQAKGAEFNNVLVYFSQARERVRHIIMPFDSQDEELGISYVAFSRARDRLFVAFPKLSKIEQDHMQSLGLVVEFID